MIQHTFDTFTEAQTALEEAGFTLGEEYRQDDRAIMFGDEVAPPKRKTTLDAIHGVVAIGDNNRVVTVTLFEHCPEAGKDAMAAAAG